MSTGERAQEPAAEEATGLAIAEIRRGFEELSERMNGRAASMVAATEAAAEKQYEFNDPRGSVVVTLNGRARVTGLHISAQAMRSGADHLSANLVSLLNDAVGDVRRSSSETVLRAVDPELRTVLSEAVDSLSRIADEGEDRGRVGRSERPANVAADLPAGVFDAQAAAAEALAELAGQRVAGSSRDGAVTVHADGRGRILRIDFASSALRGHDNHALAEQVTEAVERAFDAAEGLQRGDAGPAGGGDRPDKALEKTLAAFGESMNRLTGRLHEIARGLEA